MAARRDPRRNHVVDMYPCSSAPKSPPNPLIRRYPVLWRILYRVAESCQDKRLPSPLDTRLLHSPLPRVESERAKRWADAPWVLLYEERLVLPWKDGSVPKQIVDLSWIEHGIDVYHRSVHLFVLF